MQKRLTPIAALILFAAVSLAGCGAKEPAPPQPTEKPPLVLTTPSPSAAVNDKLQESELYGIWGISGVMANGSRFTVEQAEAAGLTTIRDVYLLFKEDGTVCFPRSDDILTDHWSVSGGSTVKIGDHSMPYDIPGKTLFFKVGDIDLLMQKISDSQLLADVPEPRAPTPEKAEESPSGIRPEFKEAMDSYRDFFDEYAAFMQKFQSNPGDMSLLLNYTSYLSRYTEAMEKLDAVDESALTPEELAYYIDTMAHVEKGLLGAIR